ncbi:MAG: alpha/beta hydrolase [Xenococcaceae cyanobacterium MO_188.B32]|nr:alpha/beta hydrolase [Xenococcaceae cyanobacterium MO_188.B32]
MTLQKTLDAISIPPNSGEKPTNLLIMLHGWGANYQDLAPLASMFNLPGFAYLFPNAPFEHPQVPGGRAWYALETEEYSGLAESKQLLRDWLLSLPDNTGIPLENTIMTGFSQGGAMTLDIGLTLPLAGLCSLSGYLHASPQKNDRVNFPPVLIVHGTQDPVVPIQAARQAKEKLMAIGVEVKYREFAMGHEIQPPVLPLIQEFITTNSKN